MNTHIVKRKEHREKFDERKIYASCYAACLSSHIPHKHAETLCEKVVRDVKRRIAKKRVITSDQIFLETTRAIKQYDKNVALMYATHRDIC